MSHPHHLGMNTPITCRGLLSHLHEKSVASTSGPEEQDSGYCTPGSAYLSFTSPDKSERSHKSLRRGDEVQEKVDLVSRLSGESSNYFPVLSKIMSYLRDEDIAHASCVCKRWNQVINENILVRSRLRKYLDRKISNAENEQELDRKTNNLLDQRSPTDSNNNKGLRSLNNITNVYSSQSKQSSTVARGKPVPSKFNIFCQEGQKLSAGEHLSYCPRCELPAKVSKQSARARCVNAGCEYDFCTACLCPYGLEPAHSCLLIPPTTPRSRRRYYTVGSKLNRASLRRLLR